MKRRASELCSRRCWKGFSSALTDSMAGPTLFLVSFPQLLNLWVPIQQLALCGEVGCAIQLVRLEMRRCFRGSEGTNVQTVHSMAGVISFKEPEGGELGCGYIGMLKNDLKKTQQTSKEVECPQTW